MDEAAGAGCRRAKGCATRRRGRPAQIDDHVRVRAVVLGLTVPQVTALREITGPMTIRGLAGRMNCGPSDATFVIDEPERQDPVERRAPDRSPHRTSGAHRRGQLTLRPGPRSPRPGLTPGGPDAEQQRALRDLLERVVVRP